MTDFYSLIALGIGLAAIKVSLIQQTILIKITF
jgi:hypothetical protein